ncbi:hypothetical protein [Mesorhizobium sp. L-8-3]|uniref:hypothetical protein n=1 Tax=Mesorhizobium sp. L-8-3 TaxID=2744522 RepID=UPI001928D60D|nr:hypothetical protein [Mesorhizobium sp. L-8-3]
MNELNATALAGFLALLIAILTVLKLISENLERTTASFRRWRDSRKRPKYILIPTAEELARYSVQEPQRHAMSARDLECELKGQANQLIWTHAKTRVALVMVTFALLFAALGIRLLYLGLAGKN